LRPIDFWIGMFLVLTLLSRQAARGHDIPNQRVDRSIQATLRPGKLEIDYEVSLTELTLTQDLRSLIGSLPGGDRSQWLARYGQVTGPLDAKGFLISCDGKPVLLSMRTFDLVVEEHPRYTFHFEAGLPEHGRLHIQDTNYVSSEGTSRLAVRARDGLTIEGDELPVDVEDIPVRPVWQLSDEEERRTKKVELTFRAPSVSLVPHQTKPGELGSTEPVEIPSTFGTRESQSRPRESLGRTEQLSRLLDRGSAASWFGLLLVAAGLGAIHAIQPGHGKTLVSAIALGPEARWYQPALLGVVTTTAHTGSVLLIASILWWTGATQVASLHRGLAQTAGFAIAAGGFWRLGRYLGKWGEHPHEDDLRPRALCLGSLLGLGLAGGLVPCWDAVGLVVLSAALGRLGAGVLLVIAFGVGMAAVLVGVGLLAARFKSAMRLSARGEVWESRLGLASGAILAGIGLVFFLQ
jgi:nickel/cobalt transporter (NicO) family protein